MYVRIKSRFFFKFLKKSIKIKPVTIYGKNVEERLFDHYFKGSEAILTKENLIRH